MFSGLSKKLKKILPKRLFYRALLIVAVPVITLQLLITVVFFDSLWIKTNKGMTRTLINGLKRFTTTKNVQDVSTTTHTMVESEAERLESELSMIRYIAWAIPSIGFIGTVRGIGAALSLAHRAVDGDISGVTQNLGVAFNSTFIALLISIVIMFMVHQLQLLQERQIFETETYCDENLITHLKGE